MPFCPYRGKLKSSRNIKKIEGRNMYIFAIYVICIHVEILLNFQ